MQIVCPATLHCLCVVMEMRSLLLQEIKGRSTIRWVAFDIAKVTIVTRRKEPTNHAIAGNPVAS